MDSGAPWGGMAARGFMMGDFTRTGTVDRARPSLRRPNDDVKEEDCDHDVFCEPKQQGVGARFLRG